MRAGVATKQGAFTLVETLAAAAILSVSVLTLVASSARAVADIRLNRHCETAASLIDMQLALIDQIGIDRFVQAEKMEGVVEQLEPGYHWKVSTELRDVDNLYAVTITVSWVEGKRPKEITVQTMLDGTGAAVLPQAAQQ